MSNFQDVPGSVSVTGYIIVASFEQVKISYILKPPKIVEKISTTVKNDLFCVFRSRKKFSTTYAIVTFFFSRPFKENFKFLKNCPYDFHKSLHSHSTPKGAPGCAMAMAPQLYECDVRNSQN